MTSKDTVSKKQRLAPKSAVGFVENKHKVRRMFVNILRKKPRQGVGLKHLVLECFDGLRGFFGNGINSHTTDMFLDTINVDTSVKWSFVLQVLTVRFCTFSNFALIALSVCQLLVPTLLLGIGGFAGRGWKRFRNWMVPGILLMLKDLHNFRGEVRVIRLRFGLGYEGWEGTNSLFTE